MPAIRDVGARFIAPACGQTVRWAVCTKLLPRAKAAGPFASSTAVVVRNAS